VVDGGHALDGLVSLIDLIEQVIEGTAEDDIGEPRFEDGVRVSETSGEGRSERK
jgi:hypothetical protein